MVTSAEIDVMVKLRNGAAYVFGPDVLEWVVVLVAEDPPLIASAIS